MTKKAAPKKSAKKAPSKAGQRAARPAKAPAKKPEPRRTTCRICKAKIEFSTGMSEIEQHWQEEHPQQLAALRRSLGHDQPETGGSF